MRWSGKPPAQSMRETFRSDEAKDTVTRLELELELKGAVLSSWQH